jgi:hypothetical protein
VKRLRRSPPYCGENSDDGTILDQPAWSVRQLEKLRVGATSLPDVLSLLRPYQMASGALSVSFRIRPS